MALMRSPIFFSSPARPPISEDHISYKSKLLAVSAVGSTSYLFVATRRLSSQFRLIGSSKTCQPALEPKDFAACVVTPTTNTIRTLAKQRVVGKSSKSAKRAVTRARHRVHMFFANHALITPTNVATSMPGISSGFEAKR